jgi:hypothetical protein
LRDEYPLGRFYLLKGYFFMEAMNRDEMSCLAKEDRNIPYTLAQSFFKKESGFRVR